MAVPNRPGILGIFLRPHPDREVRVGSIVRDANGTVTFEFDEGYIGLGRARPIVSLSWHSAVSEADTLKRLRNRNDKISHGRNLPPYFDNLLPEGALMEIVEREFGTGAFDNFDVLAKLGGDLPGAIVARREAGEAPPTRTSADRTASKSQKAITFSLAGVQLKFSMHKDKRRLTMPGADDSGDLILKLPSGEFAHLVENEFTALNLARLAGVNVSEARLVDIDSIEGVPEEFKIGKHALAISRFDRGPNDTRIHTEDFAQIAGSLMDEKYFRWNQDTILNNVKRFSQDPIGDTLESVRRLVVDVLAGNCDGHLKNWSIIFPDGRHPRLSPAYDIVSTLTYRADTMALRLYGTKDPKIVDSNRLVRIAQYLNIDHKILAKEMKQTTIRALDTWPAALKDLPAPESISKPILTRLPKLALVAEVRPAMVQGHSVEESTAAQTTEDDVDPAAPSFNP